MTLLTNSKGGMVRASGDSLEALKRGGWTEVETSVPAPEAKPKAAPRTRKTAPKTA